MSSLGSRTRLLALSWWMWKRWRAMPGRVARTSLRQLLDELDVGAAIETREATLEEVADAARLLLYRVPSGVKNTCLIRGLTLYGALAAAGHRPQIVFGVRPGQRIEDGHSWLEVGGEPFLEPDERRHGFVEIFRHPEST